ncbi:hypothetical protein [Roseomonas sp. HF4]|uniref:hypothetical protein n=1 Tax=Roseomonas sp. HF4 TaxID=2562313 RepID=UPI0010BF9F37|nr:hypothetical protein [Roseomonas sp. HF4]
MNHGTAPSLNRKSVSSWPSSRLLELAEAHPDDRDLLEFIRTELGRRDVDVAHSAAQRVAELLRGRSNGAAPPADDPGRGVSESVLAALTARLEETEQRLRQAEMRAATAERMLASEGLPARGNGLLRRVHLADTAPAWLVEAVRRAFRLRFHPDRFSDPVMKERAEETFKEAEEVFRHILGNGN